MVFFCYIQSMGNDVEYYQIKQSYKGCENKMKIITLVENTPGKTGCECEHGLSIYIETMKHKILLDTGASDLFLKNAKILDVDLTKVDMMVLSHGHYDHAGGLMEFVNINPSATIYMRPTAVKAYYSMKASGAKYIGMDERIFSLPQIKYTNEREILGEQVALFSDVSGRRFWPRGNKTLKVLENQEYRQDDFDHEQSLVIRENEKSVLISGCAHNGILNILDKYHEIYGSYPDMVITGFHMKSESLSEEDKEVIRHTAQELSLLKDTVFYSGHCTGEEAYNIMKQIMGEKLQALHSGEQIV